MGLDLGDRFELVLRSDWTGSWLQRFLDGPEVVVTHEDAAVIAVKGEGSAVAAQQLAKQGEIAERGFGGKELGGQDFSGGIILQAERGEARAAAFQPVVGRAVELHQFAFAGGAQAALAMSGSAAFPGRPQTGLPQKTAEGLAAEGEALDLAKFSQRW